MFPTKKAAQAAQVAELGKLDAGTFDDKTKGTITLAEYAPTYLAARSGEVKPRSLENYEAHLRIHIIPKWGSRRLRDIRPSEIAAWWASMPATPGRKNTYRTLSNLMRMAVDDGELRDTPCRVRNVGTDLSKPRPYFDKEAVRALWDASSDDMRAFLMVVYGGGLRISEALGLDRRHVNLETGEILVEQQLQLTKDNGSAIVPGTKNGQTRLVWLDGEELAAAEAYVKRHPVFSNTMPFFLNERGKRLSKNEVYRDWMRTRVEAGYPDARIHDLRHSSLTHLMQAGGTMADVMAFGGHKDIRAAQRYQHSDPARLRALVKARSEATG
ncbi:site-specific integrase [Leifsonia bigeumensis]|uniref:Site-specific integrase n=1 Tax=Leifsonella bigeumensis TaxID=433643 RepID=A0ABP7FR74_9MICO